MAQLKEIANEKNVDIASLVLAWYLSKEPIDAVIPGAKRPEQVLNNLQTLEIQLTDENKQAIYQIFL